MVRNMGESDGVRLGSRRDFLLSAAGAVAASVAAGGCTGLSVRGSAGESMGNFAVKPMKTIRLGYIGVGERGTWAAHRISDIPGVETAAICDLRPEAVESLTRWLKDRKKPGALRAYAGKDDSYKALCDDPNVDVVYICAPAPLHTEMELYAMNAGKHVLVEVPGAQTVDDCWAIVETAEKTHRHCMMLENCVYGENELLAWNLCHKGLLGTLTHAEGGYIHPLVWRHLEDSFRNRDKQKPGTVVHRYGNTYPTHGLGPICTYMDMNRGDRMERIVSLSSLSAAHAEFAAAKYPADAWQNKLDWRTGDMNTSIIRTAKGRTILLQEDESTPRPYSRLNLIQGTKGCYADYPQRLVLHQRGGGDGDGWKDGEYKWMEVKVLADIREKHMHPLVKSVGAVAKKVGGHGGMDFLMDIRWAYCLQNGLPLDMDVYDLASWSSVVPCSAESDRRGGEPVELPDFTRGGWKTAKPVEIGAIDLAKMGYDEARAGKGGSAGVYQ